jgi:hypothetical protein
MCWLKLSSWSPRRTMTSSSASSLLGISSTYGTSS